ncbi:MobQ family relaxase [uncultured Paracoccus sp.]|uniref:MobQ family relaxase n=2 Tax=uncultured Paracoccus sp. TaxID=189685 RepID=UPI002628A96A|nr:MobQ family relaxase [uncultured Paracoccus sp.]
MAIYHLSAKVVSRTSGRSAVAAAAYRSGERLLDARTGLAHDFRARSGVVASFIAAPTDAPDWALDRQSLWSATELHEKRSNSTTAREWEAALPDELDADQREALARSFAAAMVARFGVVADCALHAPNQAGDQRNHHLHMLTTTRAVDAQGFGAKTRELDGGKGRGAAVDEIRALWADLTNRALEAAQVNARVDHRSHETQRVEAAEAAQEAAKAERSLNPIGKREKVQRAAERAAEARSRIDVLPDAPGTHNGPQRTAQARRWAREREERERRAAERAQEQARSAVLRQAEAHPIRGAALTEWIMEEALTAFRDMQRVGVRAFVRDKLTVATELAGRFFMDRLEALGLVQVNLYQAQMDRGLADAYGAQVAAAVRGTPEQGAAVAWAAVAAKWDQPTVHDLLTAEEIAFAKSVNEGLTEEEFSDLAVGNALKAFARWTDAPVEVKFDWAERYLRIAGKIDHEDAAALDRVQQQRNAHEAAQRAEVMRRQEQEWAQRRERDHGDDYGL